MAYHVFKEIWTPLKMFGIRFYRQCDNRRLWIKIGSKRRRPLGKREAA
mgnify:CR=1 FL=1